MLKSVMLIVNVLDNFQQALTYAILIDSSLCGNGVVIWHCVSMCYGTSLNINYHIREFSYSNEMYTWKQYKRIYVCMTITLK